MLNGVNGFSNKASFGAVVCLERPTVGEMGKKLYGEVLDDKTSYRVYHDPSGSFIAEIAATPSQVITTTPDGKERIYEPQGEKLTPMGVAIWAANMAQEEAIRIDREVNKRLDEKA